MDARLKKIIEESHDIVFFGGAGVSTESNIPDFRSEKGLYHAQQEYGRSPEQMLSHSFFVRYTDTFFHYYKNNLIYREAKPNKAHLALAALEREGKLKAVVTQNIDGLHQKAGSKNVFELHGSVLRNYCMDCGEFYDLDYIMDDSQEALDDQCMMGALSAIQQADTLIVGGTSLVVYPAAGLIRYFSGKNLILINKQPTPYDDQADIVINDSIGKVMDIEE